MVTGELWSRTVTVGELPELNTAGEFRPLPSEWWLNTAGEFRPLPVPEWWLNTAGEFRPLPVPEWWLPLGGTPTLCGLPDGLNDFKDPALPNWRERSRAATEGEPVRASGSWSAGGGCCCCW